MVPAAAVQDRLSLAFIFRWQERQDLAWIGRILKIYTTESIDRLVRVSGGYFQQRIAALTSVRMHSSDTQVTECDATLFG